MSRSGEFKHTELGYTAFFPKPLPPEPNISLDGELGVLLSKADQALGSLNTIADVIPNPELFVSMYIQKEALLSSQIEGTQSTLIDILGIDEDQDPTVDVGEVINYVKALNHGLGRLQNDDFPMSLRLLREIHSTLMQQVRGGIKNLTPGEFRTTQNWIGGSNLKTARFVPPPPSAMNEAMNELESYFHADHNLPLLVRCALIHYQFETIHPFNDGNGRLGRLLITLFLAWKEALNQPMLYLSAYLKTHQQEYYDRLTQVRTDGNYEAWLKFFLEGIISVSSQAIQTTRRLQQLERDDTDRLLASNAGARSIQLLRLLMRQPVIRVKDVEKKLSINYSIANRLIAEFESIGIISQSNEGRRNRKFIYKDYIVIISEGTELHTHTV